MLRRFADQLRGNPLSFEITDPIVFRVSSQILTVIPNGSRQPVIDFVSPHVGHCMYELVLRNDATDLWNWFNVFWSVPESRASAGYIWQPHVMRDMSTGSPRTLVPRSLPLSEPTRSKKHRVNKPSLSLPLQPFIVHGDKSSLGLLIRSNLPQLQSRQLSFRPGASNQATFDFFTISRERTITLFQSTVSTSHSVKATGLDFIWDALNHAKNGATKDEGKTIQGLFPTKTKWRLIFVVPKRVEHSWQSWQNIDFGGRGPRRQWGNYIEQSVLEYPDGQAV